MKYLQNSLMAGMLLLSLLSFSIITHAEPISLNDPITMQLDLKPVNINTASAEILAKELNGVGLHKAEKIIEYREKYGPFISIEQLKEVSGIGQSLLDKNQGKITLK